MTTKQGCYFYAIKRVDNSTYYNYLYKNFMGLHQGTKLYKNNDLKFSDFLEQNRDKLQVVTLWLGEI